MSDTPISDAAYNDAPPADFGGMTAMLNCARSLERELSTLKEGRAAAVDQEQISRVECNRLRGVVKVWRECAEQLASAGNELLHHGAPFPDIHGNPICFQANPQNMIDAIARFESLKKQQQ